MPHPLHEIRRPFAAISLVAVTLTACHSSAVKNTTEIMSQPELPPPIRSSTPTPVPRMGVLSEEVAGRQRLFSTFGFWMLDEPLKSQMLGCFRVDGTLDRAKLRQTLPDARIVEGIKVVAVALPAGTFTFFLLQDGPLISLDPKFDSMVQQMSVRAYTSP